MRPWWLRLAHFAPRHWRGLSGIGLLLLATAALNALKPWPLKLLVDHVFDDRPFPSGLQWLGALPGGEMAAGLCAWMAVSTLAIFAVAWATQALQAYIQSAVALRITHGLGARVFEHLQRLSLRFHNLQPTGDLVRRVTRDSRCARDLILDVIMPVLRSAVTLAIMAFIMFEMDPLLTLLALLVAPSALLARKLFYRTMRRRSYDQQQREGLMMSQAERALTAIPIVQAFRREQHETNRFKKAADSTLEAYFRSLAAQLKFRVWIAGSTKIVRAIVMTMGAFRVLEGDLTIGGLLVFLAYVGSLYGPINTLSGKLTASLAGAEASARRVFEVLDTYDLVPDPRARGSAFSRLNDCQGHVAFEHVTFAYEPGLPALQDIDLEVHSGEVIALVGTTGAGKSTLMSLLLRFFDPSEGRVTLDGIDIRELPLTTLRSQIAILLQEPFLLPVSVADNIAYGRPEATLEEVIQAAMAANANAFVQRLPQAYDTVLGERGNTLSGGERQRLAIARALLKDAPLLILDEPTSALDAATESQLMSAVERLMKGRTTFIIAHRLSTIRHADRIVVLDEGKILESGTQEELIAARGRYHSLCQSQWGTSATQSSAFGSAKRKGLHQST